MLDFVCSDSKALTLITVQTQNCEVQNSPVDVLRRPINESQITSAHHAENGLFHIGHSGRRDGEPIVRAQPFYTVLPINLMLVTADVVLRC